MVKRMTPRRCNRLLPVALVQRIAPVAARRGVSAVARSPRGFYTAYVRGNLDPWWCARRDAFIGRHMAQARKHHEPLWKNGEPTRRHLALVMWAASPTPTRLAAWARKLPGGSPVRLGRR